MKTFSPESINVDSIPFNGPLPSKGDSILVVGSGVFGSWTALMLLRKGFNVTIADPWGPGNNRSSSGGESRLMRKLYGSNSFYTQMAIDSIPLWKELEEICDLSIYDDSGIYWFIKNHGDSFLYQDGDLYPFIKNSVSYISKEDAINEFPSVQLDDVSEILYEEEAGYIKARESVIAVHELFVKEGGSCLTQSITPGLKKEGGLSYCIDHNGNHVEADYFVFACGPWNLKLFPEIFAGKLKITRQEVLYFGYPQNYNYQLPCWVELDNDNLFYGVPNLANRGFKIALDERGPEIDPTTEDRMITNGVIDRSRSYLQKRFPFLSNAPLLEGRVCQYTNTKSGNLLILNHPDLKNTWILGGGNGHGFKHGPGFGKLFSEVMTGAMEIPLILQQL